MNLEFFLTDRPNLVERPTGNNDPSTRPATSVVLVAMFGCLLYSSSFSSLEGSNSSLFSTHQFTSSITTSFSFTTAVDTSVGTMTGSNTLQLFQLPHLPSCVKEVKKCPCIGHYCFLANGSLTNCPCICISPSP